MKKFEYIQLSIYVKDNGYYMQYNGQELPFEKYGQALLCWYGVHGWEMIESNAIIGSEIVNTALIPIYATTDVSQTYTTGFIYTFKRELDENIEPDEHQYSTEFKFFETMDNGSTDDIVEDIIYSGEAGKAALKVLYESMNFSIVTEYKTRVIFINQNVKVRYDQNSDGVWVEYK